MKHVKKIITLFIIFILQTTLVKHISIVGIMPDMLLAAIVLMSLCCESAEAGIYAALTGALMDIFAGRVFGLNTLLYLYIALGVRAFLELIYKNKPTTTAGITFAAVLIYKTIYYFLTYVIWGEGVFLYALLRIIIPTAAYTAAVQFIMYKPIIYLSSEKTTERGARV